MKFLSTNINEALSLQDYYFADQGENIDHLTNSLAQSLPIGNKLSIATSCVELCEKFHSYFHFEQSYFHTSLAKLYLELQSTEDAVRQLEKALFQDPLNGEALHLLVRTWSQSENPAEVEKYQKHCISHNVNPDDGRSYSRNFRNFTDFLKFAIANPVERAPIEESYWAAYEKYQTSSKIEYLMETVEQAAKCHALYHANAARIYYNRHIVFCELGHHDLAKNDLFKSRNLDSNVSAQELKNLVQ